jgi:hypothetical protein
VYTLACLERHAERARDAERGATERAVEAEAQVVDIQVRLNRSELMVQALLDRLEQQSGTPGIASAKRPRYE